MTMGNSALTGCFHSRAVGKNRSRLKTSRIIALVKIV